MSHLINIFLEPGKVFAELKEKPTFIVPLMVVMVATIAMTFLYFMKVDSSWFIDHTLLASGKEMSASEMAQAKSFMPGAKMMGYISIITIPIGTAFIVALLALYYLLAGKIAGSTVGFKHALSLTCWSSMPTLLGAIVVLVGVIMMSPQTSIESLGLTHLDPLLLQLPIDSPWKKLATSFDLLSFWNIFLVALGWKIWGKTSWVEGIIVAIIPIVIIYGCFALLALI
ncbi:MAG: YIP1 family protein [Arenimonas sp.]